MSYTHKLIQILINQNEMNNKLIWAFSLEPPIKRKCTFVAGVNEQWGKILSYIADIFHALAALSRILYKNIRWESLAYATSSVDQEILAYINRLKFNPFKIS